MPLRTNNYKNISSIITSERVNNKRVLWESSNPEVASVKDVGADVDESDVTTLRDVLSPIITFGYEAPSSAGAKDSSSDVHKEGTYTFTMPQARKMHILNGTQWTTTSFYR